MADGKQVINARLDGLEMAWLGDLEAQWGCNRTTALIRAIREAHERLTNPADTEVVLKPRSVAAIVQGVRALLAEHPAVSNSGAMAVTAPVQTKGWAERERERRLAAAAKAGVCPDCGDKAEYCSCER